MGCRINMTVLLLLVKIAAANGELNSVQYESELASAQQCLQDARIQIALEQNRIVDLKKKISAVDERKVRFYSEYGVTEKECIAVECELTDLHRQLKNILEAGSSSGNIDSVLCNSTSKVAAVKASKVSGLKRISMKIGMIDRLQDSLLNMRKIKPSNEVVISESDSVTKMAETEKTYYTVKSSSRAHETLYSIAESIYGDPQRWVDIYTANKALIDSNFQRFEKQIKRQNKQIQPSDFILPGQNLIIPAKTTH